jgi:hypothetical protein
MATLKYRIILYLLFLPFLSVSQHTFPGILIGGTVTNFRINQSDIYNQTLEANAGLYLNYRLNSKFFINPEILYSRQGFSNVYWGHFSSNPSYITKYMISEYYRLNYLKVPVYLGVKPFKSDFHIQLGFYTAYLLNASETSNKDMNVSEINISGMFRTFDFGCSFGIRNELGKCFNYGAAIDLGIINALKDSKLKTSHTCFMISIGYTFRKKTELSDNK